MNVRPIHTNCKHCGKPIFLIKTVKGKTLPCDTKEVKFAIGGSGRRRFVTQTGDVFTADLAQEMDRNYDKMTGWPVHNDTCKAKKGE